VDQQNDDYDSPWKMALTRYFPEFMAFFFPRAYAAIDWDHAAVFLEQELLQVVRPGVHGRRLADKLVQVTLRDGEQQWVLVHIEVQGRRERAFAERIFTYNYRVFDRYRRPVASLVLLADRSPAWRPDRFGYSLFGCTMQLIFPVVKLGDFAGQMASLLTDQNVFALMTAAHLLTRASRHQPSTRAREKARLLHLLLERNWDRERIIDLIQVIDWLMRLPLELETALTHEISQLEKGRAMGYITSFERVFRREGREEGLQQGLEAGREEGLRAMLLHVLQQRFGVVPADVALRIDQAGADALMAWGAAAATAATLDAVFGADQAPR
jgi:hypothetical protein